MYSKTSERSEQGYIFAPRAQTRGSLLPIFPAMLGGGYGDLKTPMVPQFFSNPVWRTRAPQGFGQAPEGPQAGGLRLTRATGMSRRVSAGSQSRGAQEKRAIRGRVSLG